jgi:hypothetical protein
MSNAVRKISFSGFIAYEAHGSFIYTIKNNELIQSAHSVQLKCEWLGAGK